ncbi:hypothetical protein [Acinetobacter baumannii]|uniref:hypothetical protein n=1 Tax=Acinetobacter baumannii TaxID=470 RepID=UPI002447173E|nr:hypothetical protein [Acinetobacter baumannii]MDH2524660.1 hypothetical protein [Acinetobacter baumannii]
MDNQQVQIFKEWFIDAYPECKDYLDLTYFCAEKNAFIAKCSYNPDSGNAAKVLRIAFGSWQHQQAKVEELQTLYTQQGINMLKMQKRMDKAIRLLVEAELYQSEPNIDLAVKALKGEG